MHNHATIGASDTTPAGPDGFAPRPRRARAGTAERRLRDAARARAWATHHMDVAVRRLLDDAHVVPGIDLGDLSGHTVTAVVDDRPVTIRMDYGRQVAALLYDADATAIPVTSLLHHGHDRVGRRVQRGLDQALAFARATGLEHPETIASHGPITITGHPEGASLSAAVLAHPDRTGALLEHLWSALSATRDPGLAMSVPVPASSSLGVEGAFRSLWHEIAPAWLEDIGTGWIHTTDRPALLDRIDHLSVVLNDHRPDDHQDRRVLVHGNLDCDHLILAADGTWISSPRPHLAAPEADLALLTSRLTQLLIGSAAPADTVLAVTNALHAWLSADTGPLPPGDRRKTALREVLRLWAMDILTVLATCLAMPPRVPGPTDTQRHMARRATPVLSLVDAITRGLERRPTYPEHILATALVRVYVSCAVPRRRWPNTPVA